MKESKALNILISVAKVLLIVFLALSFVYYAYGLIDAAIESANMQPSDGTITLDPLPLTFALFLILSIISNGACVLLALLGLILSLLYKGTAKRKKNIITFSILLAIPIVMEIAFFLTGAILGITN